jgi:serine/threonine-protein kinase
VALKVLARYDELVSVDRLLAEARVTSRIVSDHIVQVLDAGVDRANGDVFVVMELLHGMTLDERVLQQGALPSVEVAEYMRQIAVGLDRAHGHVDRAGRPTPIVHRDLKPSNIFISARDDGHPLLKILDFGAAKVLSQTTKASGLIRGTPLFMASEQALGEPSYPVTDVWAFGLIAFYLLTGHSYWLTAQRDGTEDQLFAEILMLPLPPASQRVRELGLGIQLAPHFDRWFSRCVNRVTTQRFGSAGLAAGELLRLLGVERTLLVSEPPRRPSSAGPGPVAVEPRRVGFAQLESQDVAALSRTRQRPHGNGGRTRTRLATLALVFAGAVGAATVVLWKRAAVPAPPASSINALSPPPAPSTGTPAPTAIALPPTAGAAPSEASAIAERGSPRPPAKATASARIPTAEKRPPAARPPSTLKSGAVPRDPYEQR